MDWDCLSKIVCALTKFLAKAVIGKWSKRLVDWVALHKWPSCHRSSRGRELHRDFRANPGNGRLGATLIRSAKTPDKVRDVIVLWEGADRQTDAESVYTAAAKRMEHVGGIPCQREADEWWFAAGFWSVRGGLAQVSL